MAVKKKIDYWDNEWKKYVRSAKVTFAGWEQADGILPKKSRCLTFAGSRAHFEKAIVFKKDLARSEDIVTIQDCRQPEAEKVLRNLIRERDAHLPGMKIWPYSFNSFVNAYKGETVRIPPVIISQAPKWYRARNFKQEMDNFIGAPVEPFDILDIDLCGPFGEKVGIDIAKLFKNKLLSESGVMFVTHGKGRDFKPGMMEFLEKYFLDCGLFDIESLEDEWGYRIEFGRNDYDAHIARYNLVPAYYIIEAFKAGYQLDIERLVEYRDLVNSRGITMLQWFFRFQRKESELLEEEGGNNLAAIAAAVQEEMDDLKYQLKRTICHSSYKYSRVGD